MNGMQQRRLDEATQKMEHVMEDERIARATDWISEVAPDTFAMYSCDKCKSHPLKNRYWYRFDNSKKE